MAKMSRTKLEQIIARDAPGYEIATQRVPDAASPRRAAPDAVSPDIEQIRKKYGVSDAGSGTESVHIRVARGSSKKSTDDSEIVLLKPKQGASDAWGGPSPKAVVVSGNRIIGRQG